MRSSPARVLGLALLAGAAWALPALASGDSGRPASLVLSGGYRIFNHQLGLQNDAALGVRVGLGVAPRFQLAIDYVLSDPLRASTHKPSSVSALRALARYDVLPGATRAYVVAGAGGLLVNFTDAPDYSTGALTAGVGLERHLTPRMILRLEGTADLYRAEIVAYDPGGAELSRSARLTDALAAISAGIGVEF